MRIKNIDLPQPIEYHETFDVIDSSKIQSFMDCPRGFFFSYVLGLRKTEPNVHLVFGSAWHEAMEHILNYGKSPESVGEAYNKFLKCYMAEYTPEMISLLGNTLKEPNNAFETLIKYVQAWRQEEFEVLFTEVAGAVPISNEDVLWVKMDSVIRDDQGYWSLEHKTTGKNSAPWRDGWSIKIQPGSYTHGLNCAFPPEDVRGIIINGTVMTKEPQFIRIPVRKSAKDMMQWLWEVKHWVAQIEWNFQELSKCTKDDSIMTAFPRNGESCSKFGCKFPGLCQLWSNPLDRFDPNFLPIGYKREYWDPRARVETAKNVLSADGITTNPNKNPDKHFGADE